ncbi:MULTISPECIES: aconitate hydratase AcnA [Pseudomonas]|jgi:aconitate hydratase|uniref:aconitate hydratase AcnA n=1 Tax=Pseudomonas TaxID=286 RepID=UPI0012423043|nr:MULTISPECIES: aconitate hydratase AcnA [Pseudomonas]MBV7528125.1 aconitate hydratase AcnA [Pseudomonas sp. PDM29]VVN37505.1 Aconitate hydratase A [Pseudomonas fluorescens]
MISAIDARHQSHLQVGDTRYAYVDLYKILTPDELLGLPYSIRILLENVARCSPTALDNVIACIREDAPACEVPFYPNRLMFHDTTCLPALADFAGMRDMVAEMGGVPETMNPMIPAVLVIDHSVIVERYAEADAVEKNLDIDYRRNSERYEFIKWAQKSLTNFKVVPPGTGIIHQVNMESLATVVWESQTADGQPLLHPDDIVATDSHTPMINAIGVLGWGVGGLEGQAAMLGEPVPISFPEVVGIRLSNELRPGVTATDLALRITQMLRAKGVVGKFVEFCGPGLSKLSWAARGTLSNMAPEYGATVVFFPFDDSTMEYMHLTGRIDDTIARIETYLEAQGLWRHDSLPEPHFDDLIELDLSAIEPSVAGPHQPHQWRKLADAAPSFRQDILGEREGIIARSSDSEAEYFEPSFGQALSHGAISLAAITSCTNTANPSQMIQAGLLARNAQRRGLRSKPWVKTSLSPGSRVVADYLEKADLLSDFSALGFDLAGFGCMTCIGNSGSLEEHMERFSDQGLKTVVVLSGNRNFEGRVNPRVQVGYLASPALVVAYALAGTIDMDIQTEPLGQDAAGNDVYLHELMPSEEQIQALVSQTVRPDLFRKRNAMLWDGTHHWQALSASGSVQFPWAPNSTYLRRPIYLQNVKPQASTELSIHDARVLMVLGDNVTTDHISPASAIPLESQAGQWLTERGENPNDLNQYSTRRSNHEVMMRGAFVNRAVKNQLLEQQPGEGGFATAFDGSIQRVYDAALSYVVKEVPLVIFAGFNYGAGSSRDWAAKAQATLGVKAVIAQSFERIHRSNLIGMGILPITFAAGADAPSLRLSGNESLDFSGLETLQVGANSVSLTISCADGSQTSVSLTLQLDSQQEILYLKQGGILPYVVRKVVAQA